MWKLKAVNNNINWRRKEDSKLHKLEDRNRAQWLSCSGFGERFGYYHSIHTHSENFNFFVSFRLSLKPMTDER